LLLEEIGRRWEAGAISVMEEHLASATVQRALAAVVDAIPVSLRAPRCLLAAAEGDEHTLGLSLVDLCLREAGWRSEWAGGRTRSSDIVGRVLQGGLDMVAISAAAAHGNRAILEAEVASVGEACEAQGVTLVLGGSGAWPEPPAYGRRFRSLVPFYAFAQSYLTGRSAG
jgi:methylmalonyl-CoA mutase cobalamin-binding subunit